MSPGIVESYRQAFAGLPRRVWLLSAVTLIHRSGTMVLPFLTIYLTTQRELSVRQAGWYLAIYGIGSVLGAVIGGRLSERFGTVPAMQLTLIVAGAGFLALSEATDPLTIAALLFVTSVAAEGFRTPSSADLGLAAPAEHRTRAFALRRLAINLGMAIGPALGGVLATVDYRWLFVVDGATCLAAGVAVTLWLRRPARARSDEGAVEAELSETAVSLWRDGVFVAVLGFSLVLNLAFAQLFGTYPLTMHADFGFSEAFVGALLAFNTVLIVLFEMVLIHWLGSVRPLRIVAAGSLVLAAGLALVPFGPTLGLAFLAVAVITVGEMLTHPVLEGFVANHVPAATIGRAMGLLTATFAITTVVAPILGTAAYDLWGYRSLWLGSAAVTLVSAIGFAAVEARSVRGGRQAEKPGAGT